jgi:hypothetical protein
MEIKIKNKIKKLFSRSTIYHYNITRWRNNFEIKKKKTSLISSAGAHRYCKTSFQYISLGISPLRLFCARSLKSVFQKTRISVRILQIMNLVNSEERKQERNLQNFQVWNLG